MKTILKLAGMILIMLCLSACRTNKLSSRQQIRSSERELFDTRSHEQQSTELSRSTVILDSSGKFYQATIFPVDTFQFSMRDGFTGKALKVELRGSMRQLMRVTEFASMTDVHDRSQKVKAIRKVENEQVSGIKSAERKRINVLLVVFFVAVFTLLAGWVVKRFRRSLRRD